MRIVKHKGGEATADARRALTGARCGDGDAPAPPARAAPLRACAPREAYLGGVGGPRCSRGTAEVQPRYSRGTAEGGIGGCGCLAHGISRRRRKRPGRGGAPRRRQAAALLPPHCPCPPRLLSPRLLSLRLLSPPRWRAPRRRRAPPRASGLASACRGGAGRKSRAGGGGGGEGRGCRMRHASRYTARLHRGYIAATSRLHLGYISATSRLRRGCISPRGARLCEHPKAAQRRRQLLCRLQHRRSLRTYPARTPPHRRPPAGAGERLSRHLLARESWPRGTGRALPPREPGSTPPAAGTSPAGARRCDPAARQRGRGRDGTAAGQATAVWTERGEGASSSHCDGLGVEALGLHLVPVRPATPERAKRVVRAARTRRLCERAAARCCRSSGGRHTLRAPAWPLPRRPCGGHGGVRSGRILLALVRPCGLCEATHDAGTKEPRTELLDQAALDLKAAAVQCASRP